MARVAVCKMGENDFNTCSKHWATTIERKFGTPASKQFTDVLKDKFASRQQLADDLQNGIWNKSSIMDILHHDKSAYVNPTFCNVFYLTLQAMIHGEECISNLLQQEKAATRNLFDECIRGELEKIGCIKPVIMRISWRQGSFCLIYSRSSKNWCIGQIMNTFVDQRNAEWLIVKYGSKTKRIQRFCPYIKPMMHDEDNETSNTNAFTLKHTVSTRTLPQNDGFMFHFYGIMAPNRYKSKLNLFKNNKNINSDLLVSVQSKLKRTDTIYALKQFIRKLYNISFTYDLLIVFGDHILPWDNKVKLRSVGITNNSLLLLAIHRTLKHKPKIKPCTQWNYTLSIHKQKGFDIITQESDANVYKMPNCGHYMNKESLYSYCLNQSLDTNTVCVRCPHHAKDTSESDLKYDEYGQWACRYCTFLNDDEASECVMCENAKPPPKANCDAQWNYCLIKQILAFDNEHKWKELVQLEILLSRNKMQKECDIQKCPGCRTLYFKNNSSCGLKDIKTASDIRKEFKTHCIRCDAWDNAFCFCCGAQWTYNHICDSSFKSELVRILNKAETKTIGDVNKVPSIRCCPNCAQLITHTDACKHMNCVACDTEFCFVCLKPMVDGEWQCGSSGDVCPIAPRQSLKTLPSTLIINKKAFKLF
eukprot:276288_1